MLSRNSSHRWFFFFGLIFQKIRFYEQGLAALAPIFQNGNKLPNLIDNCCAALARMMLTSPQHVPLSQVDRATFFQKLIRFQKHKVIPVFLRELPLKKDFAENKVVYGCLLTLLKQSNPVVTIPFHIFITQIFF